MLRIVFTSLCLFVSVLGGFFASTAHAFVDDYVRIPEVRRAVISPTGEYLAVVKDEDQRRVLAVFEFPKMKLINVVSFPGKNEVGRFWWANDERLLIDIALDLDSREDDVGRGELYAVNADGTKGKYLFGIRGDLMNKGGSSRVQRVRSEAAAARPRHMRWGDDRNVLVEITEFSRGLRNTTSAALLNIYNGRISNRVQAPTANAQMIADYDGDIRFSVSTDDEFGTAIHYLNPETNRWEKFSRADYGEALIRPVRTAKDGRIYVGVAEDKGPEGLFLMDPKTGDMEKLYQNDIVDYDRTHRDWQGNIYAVSSQPGYPELEVLDPEHPSAQLEMGLAGAFPDGLPVVVNTTHDFRYSVVYLEQDTRTVAFYLYDAKTNQLQELFDAFPWIDDEKIAPSEPIVVTARDGQKLHGYLTVPKGAEAKDLPMIVVPHGGPHGPRDEWGFVWFEGFIPANGYAMLRINFRGSGGYGKAFENAGHKKWPTTMQDDLTDATRWAIEQGIADPDRICLWGWSYGGYSALMSIVREPDLYKCSVGGAGVYDMKIQYESDFAERTRWGRKYLAKVIGDKDDFEAASAVNFVERIKTPVLLIHGDADERVPIEHSYELQKAYKKAGRKPPELIKLRNEPHSPNNPDNIRRYQEASIKFFEQHIGKGVLGR